MINKLMEMMSQVDSATMQKNIKAAQDFISSEQGQEIIKNFGNKSKSEVMDSIKSFDPKAVNISENEKKQLINELTKNPELVKKLEQFMK